MDTSFIATISRFNLATMYLWMFPIMYAQHLLGVRIEFVVVRILLGVVGEQSFRIFRITKICILGGTFFGSIAGNQITIGN